MSADFIHRILSQLKGHIMAHSFPEAPSFGHASDDRSMPSETDERRIDERFAVRGPCAYELIDRQGQTLRCPTVRRSRSMSAQKGSCYC